MEQTFKEKAERKLKDLKTLKEHLNVQLHLGTAEIKDEFENQKKNLKEWLDTVNTKLFNAKEISEEKAQKLNTSLEALRTQATLGIASTDEALIEQQKRISNGILHLQMDIEDTFGSSKEQIVDFAEEADDKLNDFHARFDLFRLQLQHGKEESKEIWEQKKKAIFDELHAVEIRIDKGIVETSEKLDSFSDQITDTWKQLKNAFKK